MIRIGVLVSFVVTVFAFSATALANHYTSCHDTFFAAVANPDVDILKAMSDRDACLNQVRQAEVNRQQQAFNTLYGDLSYFQTDPVLAYLLGYDPNAYAARAFAFDSYLSYMEQERLRIQRQQEDDRLYAMLWQELLKPY